jgi:hypothetical protein
MMATFYEASSHYRTRDEALAYDGCWRVRFSAVWPFEAEMHTQKKHANSGSWPRAFFRAIWMPIAS